MLATAKAFVLWGEKDAETMRTSGLLLFGLYVLHLSVVACDWYKLVIVIQIHVIIGINHGFQCSNIRWITRKVFEHKAAGRVFKHLPSDPANV